MMELKELISKKELIKRIDELANEITNYYKDEELVIICVLKGAFYFATHLSEKIELDDLYLDFVKVSSYGSGTKSTGKIEFLLDINIDIRNKNILIIDDIIDSGYTMNYLKEHFLESNPKSIKTCVLLDKRARRVIPFDVDYYGFLIDDKFVVGYGMDYDNKYRTLPYIGYFE